MSSRMRLLLHLRFIPIVFGVFCVCATPVHILRCQVIPGVPPADTASLKLNRLRVMVNGRNGLFGSTGAEWPGSIAWREGPAAPLTSLVYDHGLSVLGRIDERTHGVVVLWNSGYGRGPIINGRPAMQERTQDSLRYRPYTLFRGNPTAGDHAVWPLDLGAPVDAGGNPRTFGDAMIWSVANGLDSIHSAPNGFKSPYPHLPVEVQQVVYGRDGTACDSLATLPNTLLFEWTILAKGREIIDSTYVVFWTDIDIADAVLDVPAVDSAGQFAYCIDMSRDAGAAVGYCLVAGPAIRQPGNSSLFRGEMRDGYRGIGLTAFKLIGDDAIPDTLLAGPPKTLDAMWNIARGLDNRGRLIIHPLRNTPTCFPYDGAPASGTGWIPDRRSIGGGAGFMLASGPFRLAPGDTQWVMMALTAARGVSRKQSVAMLRGRFAELRSMPYDSLQQGLFPHVPCIGLDTPSLEPSTFRLSAPFPHPVHSEALLRFELESSGLVTIEVTDMLGRRCLNLMREQRNAGTHELRFQAATLPPGMYICCLRCGSKTRQARFIVAR